MKNPASSTSDDEAKSVFAALAEKTLERIREDRHRARAARVNAMLSYIERHLFTQGLTLTSTVKACQIADRSISTVFRRAVGLTPARYIESCRMEIAERLLRLTQMKISRIAELLGFAYPDTFTHAFARLFQQPPARYRNRSVAEALEQGLTPCFEAQRILLLRRAIQGELSNSEASTLLTTLSVLYPATRPSRLEIGPPSFSISDFPFNLPPIP